MLILALFFLAIIAAIVGSLTNTELMSAGIIVAVITYTWLLVSHLDSRSAK